jgi:hypothetical protein
MNIRNFRFNNTFSAIIILSLSLSFILCSHISLPTAHTGHAGHTHNVPISANSHIDHAGSLSLATIISIVLFATSILLLLVLYFSNLKVLRSGLLNAETFFSYFVLKRGELKWQAINLRSPPTN